MIDADNLAATLWSMLYGLLLVLVGSAGVAFSLPMGGLAALCIVVLPFLATVLERRLMGILKPARHD